MPHIYNSSFRFATLSAFGKDDYRKAKHIISHILDNPESFQFREPVNWEALNLLDYPILIKNPMDLNSVLRKLNDEGYQNIQQFLDDTQLIWDNCKSYNLKGTWIYNLADKLEKNCKKMLRNYFPTIPLQNVKKDPITGLPIEPVIAMPLIQHEANSNSEMRYTPEPISKSNKNKKSDKQKPDRTTKTQKNEKLYYEDQEEISYSEKLKLADKFKLFTPSQNEDLVDYIKQCCPTAFRQSEERTQILVDNMDIITFKQILEKVEEIQAEEMSGSKRIKVQ